MMLSSVPSAVSFTSVIHSRDYVLRVLLTPADKGAVCILSASQKGSVNCLNKNVLGVMVEVLDASLGQDQLPIPQAAVAWRSICKVQASFLSHNSIDSGNVAFRARLLLYCGEVALSHFHSFHSCAR